jgi:hypothetical protein
MLTLSLPARLSPMTQLRAFISASKPYAGSVRAKQIWRDGNALRGDSRKEFELRVDVFLRWANEGNRRTEWLFHDIARFVGEGGKTELLLAGKESQSSVAR